VDYLHAKFSYPSCIGFSDIVRINKQTDRQTHMPVKTVPRRVPSAWVIIERKGSGTRNKTVGVWAWAIQCVECRRAWSVKLWP